MEFFYHPWYMVAGGVLISSPIIIHLINRMRFKRIRWAAMEFLLKSQKRNQRKLIIEQLILLLLRILLVLLAAFLVARFVYGTGGSRGAYHLVIVDDTLSLLDMDREGGRDRIAYEAAIAQIKELADNAARASSAQNMQILLLSDLRGTPLFDSRLGDQSVNEIDARFASRLRKPSLLHVRPILALQRGRELLSEIRGDSQKILHYVSDFRDRDWTTGPDADKLAEEIRTTLEAGINLNLIDVASPARTPRSNTVAYHNNIALADLRAETRVAIEDADTEFTAVLTNHGTAPGSAFVQVYINGEHDLTNDNLIEGIKPGETREHRFTLRFSRRARGLSISERDTAEERERKRRLEREQFHVRVLLRREDSGVNADNVRDLVIEVRKKVPTLVIDGNRPEGRGEGGDLFHLQSFYAASGIYEIEERRLADLEKMDLELYPSIVLLNVSEIPAALIPKLSNYVNNGGSLCYFLGEEIRADHYNSVLFKAGLFPLLIANQPFDPIAASGIIDPELRRKERERLRQVDPQPKILFPRSEHPLVRRLVPFTSLFRFLSVNVYWQALPRSKWDPDLRQTESLIVLPNTSSVDKYKARALELAQSAYSNTEKLAGREPDFKKYLPRIEAYQRQIRDALARGELYKLGELLEDLLSNPGVEAEPDKPSMANLWKHPDLPAEMKTLAGDIREFRETVLYGDPLLVSRQQGKGRLVAFLSSAGTSPRRGVGEEAVAWNNWGAGERAVSELYPLFLLDLHRYLISEGQAPNRLLGEKVELQLDPNRYAPQFTYSFLRQPDLATEEERDWTALKPVVEKGQMTKVGNQFTFTLDNLKVPGVYRINLTLLGEGPEEDRQEVRAFAFNVDTLNESDLKRAPRERLLPDLPQGGAKSGKLVLRVPGDSYESFKERQPDASESSWLYLFIIIVLVAEQAMAVHLSFHTRAGEQTTAAAPRQQPAAAA